MRATERWTSAVAWGALGLFVAACAGKPGTGAAVGGTTGAVLGAGAGAAAGGTKGALIGAGVGAAAGATGGYFLSKYMDKQEKALKKDLEKAQVERRGNELLVKFNSAILFETNEADLKSDAERELDQFADVLKKYPDTNLVIEGHTDSTGPQDFNEELSWKRAQAVTKFLAGQGVERTRMSARGFADQRPAANNDTAEGRQKNRRVEIQIAANEQLKQRAAEAEKRTSSTGASPEQRAAAPSGRGTTR